MRLPSMLDRLTVSSEDSQCIPLLDCDGDLSSDFVGHVIVAGQRKMISACQADLINQLLCVLAHTLLWFLQRMAGIEHTEHLRLRHTYDACVALHCVL
jgi:hypothetical protein